MSSKYNIDNGTLVKKRNAERRKLTALRPDSGDAANRNIVNARLTDKRELFLERRAAMRHAIRVLREAGAVPGNGICTTDASTLEVWLNELQEAQS